MALYERYAESLGANISQFGAGANTDAYDWSLDRGSMASRLFFASSGPSAFVSEFGASPFIKAGLGYGAAKSAWYASRALGITSSLKDPFNPMNKVWRYRAKTMGGPAGSAVRFVGGLFSGGRSEAGFLETTVNYIKSMGESSTTFGMGQSYRGLPQVHPIKTPAPRTESPYAYLRKNILSRMDYGQEAHVRSGFSKGSWLDKYTFDRSVDNKLMNNLNRPAETLGLLHKQIIRPGALFDDMIKANPTMAAAVDKTATTAALGMNISNAMQGLRGKAVSAASMDAFMTAQEATRVSTARTLQGLLFNSGKDINGNVIANARNTALEELKGWTSGKSGKKFTLWMSKSKQGAQLLDSTVEAGRIANIDMELQTIRHQVDEGVIGVKQATERMKAATSRGASISKGTIGVYQEHALNMKARIRRMRVAKFAGYTALGVQAALGLAKGIIHVGTQVPARLAATMTDMTRMDFGSGESLSNSRLATERQRAVSAIQNAQMNARYLLGNEAQLYH